MIRYVLLALLLPLAPLVAQSASASRVADAPPPRAPAAARHIEANGEAYTDLVRAIWDGEREEGFERLFGYTASAGFPARARLKHERVLLALLRRVGDAGFARALAAEYPSVHQDVLHALYAAAGPDSARLVLAYRQTFGPRAPGEPTVATCAARLAAAGPHAPVGLPEPLPTNMPVRLPPSAPTGLELVLGVRATGEPLLTAWGLSGQADSATFAAVDTAIRQWRFRPVVTEGCVVPSQWRQVLR